jgi:hypothetical protein
MEKRHDRAAVIWIGTVLVDCAFLCAWGLVQWVAARILREFPLEGIEAWMLTLLKAAFSATTFFPIALWIYRDIAIMFYRTRADVRREKNRYDKL